MEQRVHTSEWVAWLDSLLITGQVHLEPSMVLPRRTGHCRFRAADYSPLEDVVELVLEDEQGMVRVLVESPTGIYVEHEGTGREQVVFETALGEVVIRRCLGQSLAS